MGIQVKVEYYCRVFPSESERERTEAITQFFHALLTQAGARDPIYFVNVRSLYGMQKGKTIVMNGSSRGSTVLKVAPFPNEPRTGIFCLIDPSNHRETITSFQKRLREVAKVWNETAMEVANHRRTQLTAKELEQRTWLTLRARNRFLRDQIKELSQEQEEVERQLKELDMKEGLDGCGDHRGV